MKKILFGLVIISLSLLLPFSLMADELSSAPDNRCQKMWNEVTGQTYELTLDNYHFTIVFSEGFVGPCPQGNITFLLNDQDIGTYQYVTTDNLVYINYGDTKLSFVLANNNLYLIDENVLYLERKISENTFAKE